MKRLAMVIVLLCSISLVFGQTKVDLGFKGGINLTFFNVEEANFGANAETETGYYSGIYVDFTTVNAINLQVEFLYIGLNDFKFVNAPLYMKYKVNDRFNILVGPSLNYFFDFFSNKFKVRADLGLSYNLTNRFNTHIKYTIGFEEITPNGLFLGIGFKI